MGSEETNPIPPLVFLHQSHFFWSRFCLDMWERKSIVIEQSAERFSVWIIHSFSVNAAWSAKCFLLLVEISYISIWHGLWNLPHLVFKEGEGGQGGKRKIPFWSRKNSEWISGIARSKRPHFTMISPELLHSPFPVWLLDALGAIFTALQWCRGTSYLVIIIN